MRGEPERGLFASLPARMNSRLLGHLPSNVGCRYSWLYPGVRAYVSMQATHHTTPKAAFSWAGDMARCSCAAKKHSKNYSTNSEAMKRILLLSVSLLLLAGCKTAAPLISVPRNDSIVIRDRFVRDSIYIHDSVIVRLKADTVYIEHWKELWKESARVTTDTVYKDKVVTVRLPPERYVPWLYRVALYVCIALVLYIIIRICVRRI